MGHPGQAVGRLGIARDKLDHRHEIRCQFIILARKDELTPRGSRVDLMDDHVRIACMNVDSGLSGGDEPDEPRPRNLAGIVFHSAYVEVDLHRLCQISFDSHFRPLATVIEFFETVLSFRGIQQFCGNTHLVIESQRTGLGRIGILPQVLMREFGQASLPGLTCSFVCPSFLNFVPIGGSLP